MASLGLEPNKRARICYIDTSLRTDTGHFANSCRHIAGEFRRRGFYVDIYGHSSMPSTLAGELRATPYFRHAGFENILAHFPISTLHWADYLLARVSFLQDLRGLWRRGPYDFIYVNSILPAQLAALALWLRSFPKGQAPAVAAEFGSPAGTGLAGGGMQGALDWRRHARFYSEAAKLISASAQRPLLFTFDAAASANYVGILQLPVLTMPAVHGRSEAPRLRQRRDGRITVSFLGHQRREKGYLFVPEIARRLLSRSAPVRILVHNSDTGGDPTSRELEAMAESSPDVVFEHAPGDAAYWQSLLERSDLIALPYEPARYRASYSAVAVEAVSAGVPMVVPSGTTMETLALAYQAGATVFAGWDPLGVADAIERAANNFESLAQMSLSAASRWIEANGVRRFLDRLLELLPAEAKTKPRLPRYFGERTLSLVLDVFFFVTRKAMTSARAVLVVCRKLAPKLRSAVPH